MDENMAKTLKAALTSAKTDHEIMSAVVLSLIAVIDDQLVISETVRRMAEEHARVKWLGRIVFGFATGGGLVLTVKIMKAMGAI